ncbi:hypothetical protein HALLA_18135 [Halostagnicola larsenii XH-48]|uniref:Uncharacterized protein n=1 Tax=Halostagnicola larsenii XH-48 TaxID=797299 RepID=W0JV54_9EURY|nr:hypothetical protein HALLA_18135 [Halostagnicola larsenii XH-48]
MLVPPKLGIDQRRLERTGRPPAGDSRAPQEYARDSRVSWVEVSIHEAGETVVIEPADTPEQIIERTAVSLRKLLPNSGKRPRLTKPSTRLRSATALSFEAAR